MLARARQGLRIPNTSSLVREYASVARAPTTLAAQPEQLGESSIASTQNQPSSPAQLDPDLVPVKAEKEETDTGPLRERYPIGVNPNHGLYLFFRKKIDSAGAVSHVSLEPSTSPDHGSGRSWSATELRLKNFKDLHVLWYLLLRERNLLATQLAEAKRVGVLSQFVVEVKEKDHMCRQSMARIKLVMNERRIAYEGAVKLHQQEIEIQNATVRLTRIQRKRREWLEARARARAAQERERAKAEAAAEARRLLEAEAAAEAEAENRRVQAIAERRQKKEEIKRNRQATERTEEKTRRQQEEQETNERAEERKTQRKAVAEQAAERAAKRKALKSKPMGVQFAAASLFRTEKRL